MSKSLDPRLGLSAELEPFATAIGALCMEWNDMDAEVRYCLGYCLGILPLEHVGDAILTLLDFRALVQATKLGVVDRFSDDHECVDALISTLDYLDNVVRPRRNRFVHDLWHPGVMREHKSAQIVRPQSFKPREWAWKREEPMELEEVILTIEEIRAHARFLKELWIAHCEKDGHHEWDEEWTVKGRLARQPPQRLQPLPPAKLHLAEGGPPEP